MHLESNLFKEIVKNTPLIAIDLFIIKDRKLLLGKRLNSPGKHLFFVPGGRIKKNETINKAFNRILYSETNLFIKEKSISPTFIGVDEHFYEDNFLDNKEFSTHYIVLLFLLKFNELEITNNQINLEEQHDEFIWFERQKDNEIEKNMNKYMKGYLEREGIKNFVN